MSQCDLYLTTWVIKNSSTYIGGLGRKHTSWWKFDLNSAVKKTPLSLTPPLKKKKWNSHLTNNRRDNGLPQKSGHPPVFPLFPLRAHNNKNSVSEWSLNWFSLRAPLHRKTIRGGFEYTMAELKISHYLIVYQNISPSAKLIQTTMQT